ncbi:hypothetical protein LguiA_011283 [Lonicera macranthoides]
MGFGAINIFLLLHSSALVVFCLWLGVYYVDGQYHCNNRNPVIFNFGDSNSDTGGLAAGLGYNFGLPDGRAFNFLHQSSDSRLCDGRLVIDFLCESLNTSYLRAYLDSLDPNFPNGANFAVGGSTTLPRSVPFALNIQLSKICVVQLMIKLSGVKNLVREEDFKNALYAIDIGQNDLAAAFGQGLSLEQVVEKIPSFISEIKDAILSLYQHGGKNFWVHGTGPLGCLPQKLATRSKSNNGSDFDENGCLLSLNEGAKAFNDRLSTLCELLRSEMKNATIVYADVYAIKYDLIANSTTYGFENPLMACCGYGGPPYNYNVNITCRGKGYNICKEEEGSKYISWDGVHYTDSANEFVATKILSTKYSTPQIQFGFFCN